MKKEEYNDLKEKIKNLKRTDWQDHFAIFQKGIDAYFNSLISFGINDITKDILRIFKEYREFVVAINHLYNFLIEHGIVMDNKEACKFLEDVIKLKNDKLSYYIGNLLNIKKGVVAYQSSEFLNEINAYMLEAIGLTLSFNDIIDYFNYPNDFWNYVKSNITILDSHNPATYGFYLVNIKCDEHNCLSKIRINVPDVVNLYTAKVNVHEFRHAYDLYQCLGKEINIPDQVLEETACLEEQRFINEYVKRRIMSNK